MNLLEVELLVGVGLPTSISFLQVTEVIVMLFSPISGAVGDVELTLHALLDSFKLVLKNFLEVALEL